MVRIEFEPNERETYNSPFMPLNWLKFENPENGYSISFMCPNLESIPTLEWESHKLKYWFAKHGIEPIHQKAFLWCSLNHFTCYAISTSFNGEVITHRRYRVSIHSLFPKGYLPKQVALDEDFLEDHSSFFIHPA